MKKLVCTKQDKTNKARVNHKSKRTKEQQGRYASFRKHFMWLCKLPVYVTCPHRKAWVKRQTVVHSYRTEEEEDEDIHDPDDLVEDIQQSMADGTARPPTVPSVIPALSSDVDVVIGGK